MVERVQTIAAEMREDGLILSDVLSNENERNLVENDNEIRTKGSGSKTEN